MTGADHSPTGASLTPAATSSRSAHTGGAPAARGVIVCPAQVCWHRLDRMGMPADDHPYEILLGAETTSGGGVVARTRGLAGPAVGHGAHSSPGDARRTAAPAP